MTKINRKNTKISIFAIILIIVAYFSRVLHTQVDEPVLKMLLVMLRSVIQISLVTGWCWSLRKRINNRQVRRYLIAVGILLAFWLVLRTCKWEFIAENGTNLGRYLWYAYYIPMVFVPALGVFVIDHIGKPEIYKTPNRLKVVFVPAALFVLTVITNDLHNLVFSFPNGLENCENDCEYHTMYYVVIAWSILLGIYFVAMLLKKSRVPGSKSFQKLPAIILGISILFCTLYFLQVIGGDLAAVNSLMIIALLESAIQSGLIPSNTNYNELFQISTVSAQIINDEYHPCVMSSTAAAISEDVMKKAEEESVSLGDTILHSSAITGGHVLWQDDVRQINELIEILHETRERLEENNEILKAENELKEKRARTAEKSRLYDRITKEVALQLREADELVKIAKNDPAQSKSAIAKVSVLCAYIKRRGNLLLLGEESNIISAAELEYCIRESLDNLRLGGVFTSFESKSNGKIELEQAVAVFDFYEQFVEKMTNITAMLIHFICWDGIIKMKLQVGCNKRLKKNTLTALSFPYGIIEWSVQGEDATVTLSMVQRSAKR